MDFSLRIGLVEMSHSNRMNMALISLVKYTGGNHWLLLPMVINEITDLFEKKNVISDGNKRQITCSGNKWLLLPEVTNIF